MSRKISKIENIKPQWKNAIKPCLMIWFCPYGPLVEDLPSSEDKKLCEEFGHDCPVFYYAEPFMEDIDKNKDEETLQKEYIEFIRELRSFYERY